MVFAWPDRVCPAACLQPVVGVPMPSAALSAHFFRNLYASWIYDTVVSCLYGPLAHAPVRISACIAFQNKVTCFVFFMLAFCALFVFACVFLYTAVFKVRPLCMCACVRLCARAFLNRYVLRRRSMWCIRIESGWASKFRGRFQWRPMRKLTQQIHAGRNMLCTLPMAIRIRLISLRTGAWKQQAIPISWYPQ
jgi:hypothetical protein